MKKGGRLSQVKELGYLLTFMNRKRKTQYAIGLAVTALTQTLFLIAFSLVVHNLVDFAVSRDTSLMVEAFIILGAALFLENIISPWFIYLYQRSVELTVLNIRKRLYDKLCRVRPKFLEQTHHGDLLSRVNNDVTTVEFTFSQVYFVLLLQVVFCIGSIVSMVVIDWRFAGVSFVILLLSSLVSLKFARDIRALSEQGLQTLGKMTEKFKDFMGGIQIVKLFRIRTIYGQYEALNEQMTQTLRQTAKKNGMQAAVNHFISYVTFCGIIVIGSLLYAYGMMGMGSVAALAVLQVNLTHALLNLGMVLSMTQNSLAGAHRIQEVLSEEEEPERLGSSHSELVSEAAVEFRDVEFSYQADKKVLVDMSMQVFPGQVAAIVGASGSGKSTLIKLLLGFYPVDSGDILLQGKPFGHYTLDEIRRQIAYVPQEPFLFTGTIEENIRYGNPDATDEEVVEAAKAAYAHHFIQELPEQYKTPVGERGASLSGGQRQRIAIARAILKNAPILLLDEATSALDNESQHWVQQALNVLMKGRTTILIAHRLSTVEHADLITVMNQGTVVERGRHQDLLALGGYYARLYG
ncbi:ABC transporter ATP-binding protein [Paenibacillus sp. FSL R5-0766]|uniref:ABC transporter ATP-binding protein n=1 Tax=unclassified Paenibacillus TaxID=185978 RepID=UPI00096F0D1D|nr:ABC transporter ATP-binding protein [Paenibacillus sp. FSL R5-0765]OMF54287.1 multidrug ABC transporter permease [Paenibacillus sp. FSL R5-0765]